MELSIKDDYEHAFIYYFRQKKLDYCSTMSGSQTTNNLRIGSIIPSGCCARNDRYIVFISAVTSFLTGIEIRGRVADGRRKEGI